MNKLILILVLFLSINNIFAVNEKQIILNRARNFEFKQNYSKAINLYKIAQNKFPNDKNIAEKLIQMMIMADSIKVANKLIISNKNMLGDFICLKLTVQIKLKENKVEEAKILTEDYFKTHQNEINKYSSMVRIFESYNQNRFAIKLILESRKILKDEYYLAMSLARDYQITGELEKSVNEYIKFLKKHKSYAFYISSLISKIYKNSPEIMKYLEKFSQDKNPSVQKLLADIYLKQNKFDKAFIHYKNTDINELQRFSKYLYKNKNFSQNEKVNIYIIDNSSDRLIISQAKLNLAKTYVEQNKLSKAKEILQTLINDKFLKLRNIRFRSNINEESRLLLGKIFLLENNEKMYLKYLEEAKKNTYNNIEKNKIDFKIIEYYFAKDNFAKADSLISFIKGKSLQDKISDELTYYDFISAFFQNFSEVDSLLTNTVINQSDKFKTNILLKYYYYLKNVSQNEKKEFFKAYSEKQLLKKEAAIKTLRDLYDKTKNDFYLITAFEWSKKKNFDDREIKDPIFRNYAEYLNNNFTKDKIKEFLNKNPNDFMSPFMRNLYLEAKEDNYK